MEIISRELAKKKGLEYYYNGIKCKNGHISRRKVNSYHCLECRNEICKKYSKTEKGKISRDKYKKSVKGFAAANRYRIKHKDRINQKNKKFRFENPKTVKLWRSKYNKSDKARIFWQQYRKKNQYVINRRIRDGITYSLGLINTNKKYKCEYYIGCSIKHLKKHIESQFVSGMNWKNRDEWHIDHITPIDYFVKNRDFTNVKIQKECWHYTNLRPLWASDNQKKSNKINY